MNLSLFGIFIVVISDKVLTIRVCRTFFDYKIQFNPNCYNNPDGETTSTEMIKRWGFVSEEHRIVTDDGYILLVNRAYLGNAEGKVPVVLGHGISANSNIFTNRGNKSMAYTLGINGFDVWITNYRGTKYSLGHTNLTSNDRAFWNFSFHEWGVYDLRAILQYVVLTTQKKPIYVAFSMGTTTGFIYTSTFPHEAKELLTGFVALAPVAYLRNLQPVVRIGLDLVPHFLPLLSKITNGSIGQNAYIFNRLFCSNFGHQFLFCEFLKGFVFGWNFHQLDPLDLPIINTINGDLISLKVLSHYSQVTRSGKFQMYNYGAKRNQIVYGGKLPPEYNLGNIEIPVSFLVGANDRLATNEGAMVTYQHLRAPIRCGYHFVKDKNFAHNDFPEARDVVNLVNLPVVELIRNLLKNNQGFCTG